MATKLQCEQDRDCTNPVTHIGAKGYLYCTKHREYRRGVEVTRPLKLWEIERLKSGKPLIGWDATRAQTAAHDLQA